MGIEFYTDPAVAPAMAIYGEAEAGQAVKVRKQINNLIKGINTSTFDLMDALHEVKTKQFYLPKFETFIDYVKSLDLKVAKAYYLVQIKTNMLLAGVTREVYEPVGISKLRTMAEIPLVDQENNVKPAAVEKVKAMIAGAATKTGDELKIEVDEFNGNVGEDAFEWMNLKIKKAAKAVIRQALDLIKLKIGSVGKNGDGVAKDASDGSALEKMSLDYLSDPNNAMDLEMLGPQEPSLLSDDLPSVVSEPIAGSTGS